MRRRGAYVVKLDLDQPHLAGVANKVHSQVRALTELPADVDLYHLSDGTVVCNGEPVASAGNGKLARRIANYLVFHFAIAKRRAPLDFVYIRHQGTSPLSLFCLARLRRKNPGMAVIVEFPSWPYYAEAATLRQKVLAWSDRLSRRHLHRFVDRIMTFSRRPDILGIPTITTDNGVDLDGLTVLPAKAPGESFRLAGLANLSFWHGYDRVIEGIAQYYEKGGKTDVHFDVVGTGSELPHLQEMVDRYQLESRVHFHGLQRGADLARILGEADLGISSIGMHRLDVDTSNLKSREFCARGLPFVIAYPDRDFPPRIPFVYQAPADDTPIDVSSLIAFHRDLVRSLPNYRVEMRTYAERNLGWTVKMQPALDALRELVHGQERCASALPP